MIKIQNIYYMLAYAFYQLQQDGIWEGEVEQFENTLDLLGELFYQGLRIQVKQGLKQEYRSKQEVRKEIRGKIHFLETVKRDGFQKQQMVCSYQQMTKNCQHNQIIKTTLKLLLDSPIEQKRKNKLKRLLRYFYEIEYISLEHVQWKKEQKRGSFRYQFLITLCYLIVKGFIQKDEKGNIKFRKFLDEQRMSRLYEKFLLEYYKKEMPMLTVKASQISWVIDEGETFMLPKMQTDIMISNQEKTLIIDAKYYENIFYTRQDFGTKTIHSKHLYQIFTYVKNQDKEQKGNVYGLLLYAKTEEEDTISYDYKMSGNRISVKTLDLNVEFSEVKEQLNQIIEEIFGNEKLLT